MNHLAHSPTPTLAPNSPRPLSSPRPPPRRSHHTPLTPYPPLHEHSPTRLLALIRHSKKIHPITPPRETSLDPPSPATPDILTLAHHCATLPVHNTNTLAATSPHCPRHAPTCNPRHSLQHTGPRPSFRDARLDSPFPTTHLPLCDTPLKLARHSARLTCPRPTP